MHDNIYEQRVRKYFGLSEYKGDGYNQTGRPDAVDYFGHLVELKCAALHTGEWCLTRKLAESHFTSWMSKIWIFSQHVNGRIQPIHYVLFPEDIAPRVKELEKKYWTEVADITAMIHEFDTPNTSAAAREILYRTSYRAYINTGGNEKISLKYVQGYGHKVRTITELKDLIRKRQTILKKLDNKTQEVTTNLTIINKGQYDMKNNMQHIPGFHAVAFQKLLNNTHAKRCATEPTLSKNDVVYLSRTVQQKYGILPEHQYFSYVPINIRPNRVTLVIKTSKTEDRNCVNAGMSRERKPSTRPIAECPAKVSLSAAMKQLFVGERKIVETRKSTKYKNAFEIDFEGKVSPLFTQNPRIRRK